MTNRSMETRLARLEQQSRFVAETVVFQTIYEGKAGEPDTVHTWWIDPVLGYRTKAPERCAS